MPIDPNRVRDIFLAALELTPEERPTYLAETCRHDADLRAEVDRLLLANADPDSILEPPASQTTAAPTEQATANSAEATADHANPDQNDTRTASPGPRGPSRSSSEGIGAVISGRYTLAEVIGEGGMGSVYLASQTDPVKRDVALKLIKTGMDSRGVLARFDAERQALAMMDHPNIARIYDGGVTPTGQPFFVMELVKGEPLTSYCDKHRLSIKARLELFVAVCQAVQHAHQKGIIHRDLKPSNILVTEVDGKPTPKVIDFGVAKATEVKLTDMSLADIGAIVGTPAYMSPEQADPTSMDIDTRSDVYSLGVILYELLAGSPPIDPKQFHRGAILEMLRMVREDDPPRPSTKLSTAEALPSIAANRNIDPAHLRHSVRGDLDWVVMKALEKDRKRRYETANGFAADILRHLANEPVEAAPPSRGYRLRKFVRKHRGPVIAASLLLISLLAGITGTALGLLRADWALQLADSRAEELKYRLGVSNTVLAAAAYDNNNVVLAAERLDEVPLEQRGWEWRYLKQQVRGGLFTLYGHTMNVNSVAFSPDGSRIATGSWDKTAKVWDARTGESLLELNGHSNEVTSVSFSPDGTRIVTGSSDRRAKVWDAKTGASLLELRGHKREVTSVSFSPDGTRIVTGSRDNTAKVWDARTGASLVDLKGHKWSVRSASYSPDGTRIITGSSDGTAKVWDALTGASLVDLQGHQAEVTSVAFSPDGKRIATGSLDKTARVWDARTGASLIDLRGHTRNINSVSLSPDGTRIVTGSEDKSAKVWDAVTGASLVDLKGQKESVTSVSFNSDGTRILTGSSDQNAKVWDARTGASLIDLRERAGKVTSVSFSPDGKRFVTGSENDSARVWDALTGAFLFELGSLTGAVTSVSFSPDGKRIVTGTGVGFATLWDAQTGEYLMDLRGHSDSVMSVAFSPDGKRILTGSLDKTACVWDARTGASLLVLRGHTDGVLSVAFSPDGTRIVTGSSDNTAKVWYARTDASFVELIGHTDRVTFVEFLPGGTRIETYSSDKTFKLWDVPTGKELKGVPIPRMLKPSKVSPYRPLFAHTFGNTVELLPLKPGAKELEYRRLVMKPDPRCYRECYNRAKGTGDTFAAQFYLNLLPTSEKARIVVEPLFATLGLREDVVAALKAQPASDPEIQSASLALAETWPEDVTELNNLAWPLVAEPGQPQSRYARGLRLAEAVNRINADDGLLLNTLGVAQYRSGLLNEALATLTRSDELNGYREPADLAFLALAQHRLGQSEKARNTLAGLREAMKDRFPIDLESTSFLREAEAIELDLAFPANPFAQ